MSTSTPVPTTPKVRTYAADLTATRNERGLSIPTAKPVVTEKPKAPVIPRKEPVRPPIKVAAPVSKPAAPAVTKTITTPTALPLPTPSTPKVNPPFHTLSKSTHGGEERAVKKIDTADFDAAAKVTKPSVLATPGIEQLTVSRKDTSGTGTIITDTKQNHVSFLSALVTTITGWWQAQQKAAIGRKQPKYTVPDVERRKGVVQKATTQTGRTSTADHAVVMNRIKSAKLTPRGTPLPRVAATSPQAPSESATGASWSTDTEIIETVSSLPVLEPVVIESVPEVLAATVAPETVITQPTITPTIPVIPSAPIRKTVSEVVTEPIPIYTTPKQQDVDAATVETPSVTPFSRPRIEPTIPTITVTPTRTPVVEPTEEVATPINQNAAAAAQPNWSATLQQRSSPPSFIANLKSFLSRQWWTETFRVTNNIVIAAGLGCGIVVVGWYGTQAVLSHSQTRTVVEIAPNTLFSNSVLSTPETAPRTKQELLAALTIATTEGEPLIELSLAGTNGLLSPRPQAAFDLLGAAVVTDFSSSINQVVAGRYRAEPWLVFITTDTATAQGGMLAWEKTLSADLAPWFGAAVQRNSKAGITPFKDGSVGGRDVRILTDDTGTERIMYGFIAPNTLLITTNTTAFLNLSEKVIK